MRSRKIIIIKEKEQNLRDSRDTMEHNYISKIQIPKQEGRMGQVEYSSQG